MTTVIFVLVSTQYLRELVLKPLVWKWTPKVKVFEKIKTWDWNMVLWCTIYYLTSMLNDAYHSKKTIRATYCQYVKWLIERCSRNEYDSMIPLCRMDSYCSWSIGTVHLGMTWGRRWADTRNCCWQLKLRTSCKVTFHHKRFCILEENKRQSGR